MEPERIAVLARIDALASQVTTRIAASHAAMRTPEQTPEALAEILATLSFLGKWTAQLHEANVALSI